MLLRYNREWSLIHATTYMNLENILLNEKLDAESPI